MNPFSSEILPAIRDLKDLDRVVKTDYEHIVLLNTHVGQLKSLMKMLKSYDKKVLLHADLVQGLKTDEYAAQFLCRDIKPFGLVSTRKSILHTAKKSGLLTVQRMFLLDSIALESSFQMFENIQPDCVEVLPGIMPHIISEIKEKTGSTIIAGGLIRTELEARASINAGASAVTTSNKSLWM